MPVPGSRLPQYNESMAVNGRCGGKRRPNANIHNGADRGQVPGKRRAPATPTPEPELKKHAALARVLGDLVEAGNSNMLSK